MDTTEVLIALYYLNVINLDTIKSALLMTIRVMVAISNATSISQHRSSVIAHHLIALAHLFRHTGASAHAILVPHHQLW